MQVKDQSLEYVQAEEACRRVSDSNHGQAYHDRRVLSMHISSDTIKLPPMARSLQGVPRESSRAAITSNSIPSFVALSQIHLGALPVEFTTILHLFCSLPLMNT